MTVYIVTGHDYDGEWVEGVYSTKEKADSHVAVRYAEKQSRWNAEGWNVEEWKLDDNRLAK
jgi:hypothetical protein